MYKSVLFVCLLGFNFGCSKASLESKLDGKQLAETFYVLGDPNNLYKGATLKRSYNDLFITNNNKTSFNNYKMNDLNLFFEKKNTPDLGAGVSGFNGGCGKDNYDELSSFKFAQYNGLDGKEAFVYYSPSFCMAFVFTVINGKLDLVGIETEFGFDPVEALHYSRLPSNKVNGGDSFSILFKADTTKLGKNLNSPGKLIGSVYFSNETTTNGPLLFFQQVAETYKKITSKNFLFDTGIRWDKSEDLEFSICGELSSNIRSELTYAVNEWNKVTMGNDNANELNITVKSPSQFYPFSDLTQNCIYTVDQYLIDGVRGESQGFIAGVADMYTNKDEIVSGMIMIFAGGFEKYYGYNSFRDPRYVNDLKSTAMHEIGHVIGLAHKCVNEAEDCYPEIDRTAQTIDCSKDSIMSYHCYGNDKTKLQDYDKQAAQSLYQ